MKEQADNTCNIKFNPEPENKGKILFTDTLITRKPDGMIKLHVYQISTYMDQYLHFTSHHPVHQNMGCIMVPTGHVQHYHHRKRG